MSGEKRMYGNPQCNSNFLPVRIQQKCDQQYIYIYMYIQESPVEIQPPAHWNLIGCSKTTLLPVSSPTSILLKPTTNCAFIATKKNSTRVSKKFSYPFSLFSFLSLSLCLCFNYYCITLKLHRSVYVILRCNFAFRPSALLIILQPHQDTAIDGFKRETQDKF